MINSGKASVSDLKKLHKPYISQRGKPAEMCKKTGMINENEGADWLARKKMTAMRPRQGLTVGTFNYRCAHTYMHADTCVEGVAHKCQRGNGL